MESDRKVVLGEAKRMEEEFATVEAEHGFVNVELITLEELTGVEETPADDRLDDVTGSSHIPS